MVSDLISICLPPKSDFLKFFNRQENQQLKQTLSFTYQNMMLLTTHVKELVKNIKNQPKTQPQTNILPTPQPQNSPITTEQPQVTTNPIPNRNEENTDFQGYQLFAIILSKELIL